MGEGRHSRQTASDGIHIIHAYEYADETARLAATGFVAGDVGKVALQEDDPSWWLLTDYSPITWVELGGGAVTDTDAIHKSSSGEIASISAKATPVAADLFLIEDSADSNSKKRVQLSSIFVNHASLRQLIHFIDNGPAEGFVSGAYREVTGTVFPSAVIWYDQAGVGKKKIVEKLITYSGAFPATITWKVYDATETLLATVVDTLTYSGAFETSRTRTIS
jgi:hypothetical protein